MSETKLCPKCRVVKPLEQFLKDASTSSGYRCYCRPCDAEICRDYYRKNAESRRKWARDHSIRYYKKKREARKGTPKEIARDLLRKAVKHGRITKPSHCQRCGAKKLPRLLGGHHSDYSKPLEVIWLCAACHAVEHRVWRTA